MASPTIARRTVSGDRRQVVTVSIEVPLIKKLDRLAERQSRSRSSLVEEAVRDFLYPLYGAVGSPRRRAA